MCGGDYDIDDEHGECDVVIETGERVVFLELKKKPLTRRARAGWDVDLLLDLTGSLLASQAQAGWHELRLRKYERLELKQVRTSYNLERKGREIERVAISLFDYGGFQDRIFLQHLLETTLDINFSPVDQALNTRFKTINEVLREINTQLIELHVGKEKVEQPFFHCWFLSMPQLLVLIDDVTDAKSFWDNFAQIRHITTGSSDFYYDFSYMKRLKETVAVQEFCK